MCYYSWKNGCDSVVLPTPVPGLHCRGGCILDPSLLPISHPLLQADCAVGAFRDFLKSTEQLRLPYFPSHFQSCILSCPLTPSPTQCCCFLYCPEQGKLRSLSCLFWDGLNEGWAQLAQGQWWVVWVPPPGHSHLGAGPGKDNLPLPIATATVAVPDEPSPHIALLQQVGTDLKYLPPHPLQDTRESSSGGQGRGKDATLSMEGRVGFSFALRTLLKSPEAPKVWSRPTGGVAMPLQSFWLCPWIFYISSSCLSQSIHSLLDPKEHKKRMLLQVIL